MRIFSLPRNEEELRELMDSAYASENRDFDFKAILPKEASRSEGREKLTEGFRECCCAFANSTGGHLIVGVKEVRENGGVARTREIVGSTEYSEINTEVSRLIDSEIHPAIPHWSIHTVPLAAEGRYVHFIAIPASPSYRKPHMFDGKIYRRLSGQCVALRNGADVRRIAECDFFVPGSVEAFKDFIDSCRKLAADLPPGHRRYLLNLGQFLIRNRGDGDGMEAAYNAYLVVDNLVNPPSSGRAAPQHSGRGWRMKVGLLGSSRTRNRLSSKGSGEASGVEIPEFVIAHEVLNRALDKLAETFVAVLETVE